MFWSLEFVSIFDFRISGLPDLFMVINLSDRAIFMMNFKHHNWRVLWLKN